MKKIEFTYDESDLKEAKKALVALAEHVPLERLAKETNLGLTVVKNICGNEQHRLYGKTILRLIDWHTRRKKLGKRALISRKQAISALARIVLGDDSPSHRERRYASVLKDLDEAIRPHMAKGKPPRLKRKRQT